MITTLTCISCNHEYDPLEIDYTCPKCGAIKGTLEINYDYDTIKKELTRDFLKTCHIRMLSDIHEISG